MFEENFRREAHRAAKFRHPNVIAIHYAGKDDDIVFFSMDLLETGLKDLMVAGKPMDEGAIIKVGMDVASALQFAHTHEGGIVHRDLKPDNILFDRHGNAVVTDFGISEAATNYTAATGTTVYVGTPKYMSPEQARGHRVDHRSDIYSLGVTLYEMATGEAPFTGRDWFELGRKHIEELPGLPREKNAELDADLERIVLKCLQKNPADRYQSAEHLRSELARLEGATQRTVVLTVQKTEEEKTPTPVTPAPSVAAAQESEAREAQRSPADLYEATTQPPKKKSRVWIWLAAAAVLAGTVTAYATDLAGFRTFGEAKAPFLANLPVIGTGSVYVTSFYYAAVEGGADVEDAAFDIRFSAPIDPTTASRENVKLIGPSARLVAAEVEVREAGTRITVVPSVRLAYNTRYEIQIGPGLLSARGDPIRQNARASQPGAAFPFNTRLPPPDTERPYLSESTPTQNARNVSTGASITLSFNELVDPSTVNSESILLRDAQGTRLQIGVFTSEDGRTAQIQPATSLRPGTRYALVLTNEVRDLAGNRLVPDSLVFSTRAAQPTTSVPAAPGTITVNVMPPEARNYVKLLLDNEDLGYVPKLNVEVSSRVEHNLRLVGAPPYSAFSMPIHREAFTLGPGQHRDIIPEIGPFGWITVTTAPDAPAADVFIDGEYVSSTPLAGYTLPSGPHKLELHPTQENLSRYGVYTSNFTVPRFGEERLTNLRLPAK
ncbi:MAG: Ig-like domain-containing protein [Gemmatimonadota bacterium]|nr:MAG: Ig-like domain-containing protein [Gemmatimonadota bacterium]